MYGLVNQGLKDMVCAVNGEETWRDVCKLADIAHDDFSLLEPYEDAVTHRIVTAISKVSNTDANSVLSDFGKYWVTFTAEQGYGPIMELFGKDFKTCLINLNRMHSHMGAAMPKLTPPKFTVVENGDRILEVRYSSARVGLAPMVYGLLAGLAEKFAEKVTIQHKPRADGTDYDTFLVKFADI